MSISQKTLVEAISSKFHVITPFLDKVNAKKLLPNVLCSIYQQYGDFNLISANIINKIQGKKLL